jgi:hypothetical protein
MENSPDPVMALSWKSGVTEEDEAASNKDTEADISHAEQSTLSAVDNHTGSRRYWRKLLSKSGLPSASDKVSPSLKGDPEQLPDTNSILQGIRKCCEELEKAVTGLQHSNASLARQVHRTNGYNLVYFEKACIRHIGESLLDRVGSYVIIPADDYPLDSPERLNLIPNVLAMLLGMRCRFIKPLDPPYWIEELFPRPFITDHLYLLGSLLLKFPENNPRRRYWDMVYSLWLGKPVKAAVNDYVVRSVLVDEGVRKMHILRQEFPIEADILRQYMSDLEEDAS